ncbi:MAG: hypothetical protein M3P37_00815 [Actinomycetota bacterium]|nr:hypothetical protein [Actinomycetota bacterium]
MRNYPAQHVLEAAPGDGKKAAREGVAVEAEGGMIAVSGNLYKIARGNGWMSVAWRVRDGGFLEDHSGAASGR